MFIHLLLIGQTIDDSYQNQFIGLICAQTHSIKLNERAQGHVNGRQALRERKNKNCQPN